MLEIYNMLNENQKDVVNELNRNVFLIAPAGTGKTNTLAARVSNIIKLEKAKAEEILCITFTNKACKEMKERIESVMEESASKITIKTFHGFCLQIIREYAKRKTDIFSDFIVYDEEDCKDIIKRINFAKTKDGIFRDLDVSRLQRFINTMKEARLKYNIFTEDERGDYQKVIKMYKEDENNDFTELFKISYGKYDIQLKKVVEEVGYNIIYIYNKVLNNNRALDFNDLPIKAKYLFEDREVIKDFQNRYRYINIDEMQDTSIGEYKIIEKIFGSNNILLAGDKFQTIYGWRGSEPEKIFNRFREFSPRVIVFKKNYRSTKIITEASMEYLKNSFGDMVLNTYEGEIETESTIEGNKIEIKDYDRIADEARGILSKVKELEKLNELKSACILTRSNNYNKEISKELKLSGRNNDFEFILVEEFKFFRRTEIKDIIAFFKYLANKNDSVSLKRILLNLDTRIGKETLDKIDSSEYRKVGVKLTDYLSSNSAMGEFYSPLIEAFEKEEIIVFDVESTGKDVTEDEIIQIAAIKLDKEGNIKDSFERFIKPNKSVGISEKVHGFSDEYLAKVGEEKEKVFKEFIEYTKNQVVVGHNVNYDVSIFSSELSRLNMGKPLFKGFFDTLDIYRRFHPNEKNHKLEYLSEIFGTKHEPSHNAMDDIIATGELLTKAIKEEIKPTSLNRIMYIGKHYKSFQLVRERFNALEIFAENHRPYEIVREINDNFNIIGRFKVEEREQRAERIEDLYKLLTDLDIKEKSPRDSIIEVVNFTTLSNGDMEEMMVKRKGKVRIPIITVHQAKGLEFDYVFIAGLNEGLFPMAKSTIEEEKRLFYVALTRAKKRLYLSYARKNNWDRDCYESSFIGMLSDKYVLR